MQLFVVRRPLDAAEAGRVQRMLGSGTTLLCDVHELTDADLGTVDALARLHLAAGRAGAVLVLVGVPAELRDLLQLAGLAELVAG